MDPYAVLGLPDGADPDAVTRAYRELAKRHHPDHAPAHVAARMVEINAAYDQLKRQVAAGAQAEPGRSGAPGAPEAAATHRRRRSPGEWLAPHLRRQLGIELLRMLEPQEPVLLVVDAATWDSPSVRLALTDRRLLWLRDDVVVDRVRSLRYAAIERAEARRARRRSELRLHPRGARRISFAALAPDTLERILRIIPSRLVG